MTLEIWWREGACPGREEGWGELPVKPDAPYALVATLQPHQYQRTHKFTHVIHKYTNTHTRSHRYTLIAPKDKHKHPPTHTHTRNAINARSP